MAVLEATEARGPVLSFPEDGGLLHPMQEQMKTRLEHTVVCMKGHCSMAIHREELKG